MLFANPLQSWQPCIGGTHARRMYDVLSAIPGELLGAAGSMLPKVGPSSDTLQRVVVRLRMVGSHRYVCSAQRRQALVLTPANAVLLDK